MVIVGLTGSIGMGKSTAASLLRSRGLPIYDSDRSVHALLARGGKAVPKITRVFPDVIEDGAVNRRRLGERVFRDEDALRRLEAIIHPLVREVQDRFLKRCAARREEVVILDIPLLFELGLDARCDLTIVVTAPAFLQAARVLARPGMTRQKLDGILSRQIPDAEKRRRCDFVVQTGAGKRPTLLQLTRIARVASDLAPRRWPPNRYAEKVCAGGGRDARNRS